MEGGEATDYSWNLSIVIPLNGGVQDDRVTEMAIFMYGNWTENGKLEVKLTKNRRKINFEPKSVRRRADFALFW